ASIQTSDSAESAWAQTESSRLDRAARRCPATESRCSLTRLRETPSPHLPWTPFGHSRQSEASRVRIRFRRAGDATTLCRNQLKNAACKRQRASPRGNGQTRERKRQVRRQKSV